jgi:hypothetical protein
MTIDTRNLIAPCGNAIPLSAHRVTRARAAAAPRPGSREVTSLDGSATHLQASMTVHSEHDPAARRVRRGTSLAALDGRIINRDDRRRTGACMRQRAQMVFDIRRDVPEYVRLLCAVGARRSRGIGWTRHTAARHSDLRRMRGDWK